MGCHFCAIKGSFSIRVGAQALVLRFLVLYRMQMSLTCIIGEKLVIKKIFLRIWHANWAQIPDKGLMASRIYWRLIDK